MGGGNSGGSSGQVDYPEYMRDYHGSWLAEMDVHTAILLDSNPYLTATAYNPDTALSENSNAIAIFNGILTAIDSHSEWQTAFDLVSGKMPSEVINVSEQVDSFTDISDNDIITKVLPQFKRGMQNVGASMGSAFVIGEAIIWASRDRDLAKFQTDLELKNAELNMQNRAIVAQNVQLIMQNIIQEAELWKSFVHYTIEHNRIKIVAKSEETVNNLEYDVKDARWEVSAYAEAGNLLASISGAAVAQGTQTTGPSKVTTALGGGISGAAAGAMIGNMLPTPVPGMGALIGGALGAAGGLL